MDSTVPNCAGQLKMRVCQYQLPHCWVAVVNLHYAPALAWTPTMLVFSGSYLTITQRDTAYGVVLVWALVAVFAKQERWPIGAAALVCVAINGVAVVISILRRRSALIQGDYVAGYSEL